MFFTDLPILSTELKRCADAVCGLAHNIGHFGRLRGHNHRPLRLHNAGFFCRDAGHLRAEEVLVVKADRGDASEQRVDEIGRIQPPTQPDFEQQIISLMRGKGAECGGRGNLKKRNILAIICRFAERQIMGQFFFADDVTGQRDAFVEID